MYFTSGGFYFKIIVHILTFKEEIVMQCSQCGTQYPDGAPACPNCGAPAGQFAGGYGAGPMTKKEFYKHPNLKKTTASIKSSAIILYVCGALSLVLGFIAGNMLVILDIAIVVGFGLGIQLAQSRVCALLILAYSIFNTISVYITTGAFGGYLILLAAIYAVIATFQFQKAWKEYQKTGMLPLPK